MVDGLIDVNNSRNSCNGINRESDNVLRKTLLLGSLAIRAASWPMRNRHLLNVERLLRDSEWELLWAITTRNHTIKRIFRLGRKHCRVRRVFWDRIWNLKLRSRSQAARSGQVHEPVWPGAKLQFQVLCLNETRFQATQSKHLDQHLNELEFQRGDSQTHAIESDCEAFHSA